ncbi:nucleotidyltransferase domain-containing protein [Caldivirga sp.]|uniref:nucleotidyltransferase domain-containing protein n=1 Tax=Caldivirga sp. TaxID=2080243 RepID=UPI003D11FA9D
MFEKWLVTLREISRRRELEAEQVIQHLCGRSLAVALFGSRARGNNTPLSDWDLLAIVSSGEYKIEQINIGQIVRLPLSRLNDIIEYSMIILDAITDGKLLCGDPSVFNEVKARVDDYVHRMGLTRTSRGWFKL